MRISTLIAGLALPLAMALPGVALAQQSGMTSAAASTPSPAQMQAAVKSGLQAADPDMRQKRQIKSLVDNYQSQTANASDATKKTARENLLKGIYGVLTPDQQTKFKAAVKASLGSSTP